MRSRILLGTIFGAAGGFLGYLLQEVLVPHNPGGSVPTWVLLRLGMYVGAMIGIGIGAIEGAAVNSPRLLLRGMALGAIIGALGGITGAYVGGVIYNWALFGKDPDVLEQSHNMLDFTHAIIARAIGWTFLGAFPGLAAGAATLSRKKATHGLIGGLVGGFLGGILFNLVAKVIAAPVTVATAATDGPRVVEVGGLSRAIGITLIGLLTGLFIGLVEELLKQAWVRVLAGKNEGKDYIIGKAMTVLGRDERADVPLFGDPALAPQHAAIKMEANRHYLLDGGTPIGSVVNGQRISGQQILRDGDMIQLGQVRLLFREKATASKIGKPAVDAPRTAAQAPGAVSMPSHLCPFCGAAKDAQGGCLCTVQGQGAGAGAGAGYPVGSAGAGFGGGGYTQPFQDQFGGGAPIDPGFGQPAYGGVDPGFGQPAYGAMGNGVGPGTRLVALGGPYAGQAFPIMAGGVSIGRAPENAVSLVSDSTISRRHAHIAEEAGQHVIYDDGSSNGTFVNRVRVSVQALAPGDVVQFGSSSFRYE